MLPISLSRQIAIFAILYALLAAIAVIVIDLRVVLIPTAGAAVVLFAAGLFVFPIRGGIILSWPAQSEGNRESPILVVNEQPCPFQGYEQDLLIQIRPKRLPQLLACFLLAAATLYVTLSDRGTNAPESQIGPFEAEMICITGGIVLITSLRWFWERNFLRSSRVRFGTILGVGSGFHHRVVGYQFFDDNGERRGGNGRFPDHTSDNVVLVLYNRRDADSNMTHHEFFFQSFRVGLLPGRRKVRAEAGAKS